MPLRGSSIAGRTSSSPPRAGRRLRLGWRSRPSRTTASRLWC